VGVDEEVHEDDADVDDLVLAGVLGLLGVQGAVVVLHGAELRVVHLLLALLLLHLPPDLLVLLLVDLHLLQEPQLLVPEEAEDLEHV
jgi:hypothetical protein